MTRYDWIRIGCLTIVWAAVTAVFGTILWLYVSDFSLNTNVVVEPFMGRFGRDVVKEANALAVKGGLGAVVYSAFLYAISCLAMWRKAYKTKVAVILSAITVVTMAAVILHARNFHIGDYEPNLEFEKYEALLNTIPPRGAGSLEALATEYREASLDGNDKHYAELVHPGILFVTRLIPPKFGPGTSRVSPRFSFPSDPCGWETCLVKFTELEKDAFSGQGGTLMIEDANVHFNVLPTHTIEWVSADSEGRVFFSIFAASLESRWFIVFPRSIETPN